MHDDNTFGDISHDDPHLTAVFSTSQVDLIPVIKSVLRGAGIPYIVHGEGLSNLFPSDMLGPTMHAARGEVRFQVAAKHVEAARAVLAEYDREPGEELPGAIPQGPER